ncbi:hypothetical protein BDV32DRAFT_150476 [Aspergillus pseudonomiae]|nr:hypothetical protein BDV32DRAFT_150476 [Aspergillus pseudonomiae]
MAKMDLNDIMSKWGPHTDTEGDPNAPPELPPDIAFQDDDDDEIFDEGEQDTDILPELSTYKEFVSNLPSYAWLLRNIRKEIYLSNIGETHTNIRRAILDCLPKAQHVSRKQAPPRHTLILIADWNPNTFLEEQGYLESPMKAIERAITITGSRTDAQAATTIQYLSQTWPSTGIHLLRIVKHIVVNAAGERYSYNLPDGTKLIACLQGSEVRLEVTGISECIAEIGEQLAWLGAALRSSPYETGVAVCNAFASEFGMEELEDSTSPSFSRFFFHISFNLEFVDEAEISSSGQCWHQLFGNPVIVSGYPILRRPMSNLGIEISLDTMARLVKTQHINTFNRKFYIKGFCVMLVPTHSYDDIIVWHLLHKRNGERISYNETISGHADISLSALEKSRHILGWCPKVRYLAGAADATYSIDRSWLRGPQAECKLKDAQVSQGKLIQSDHKAAFGNKDKSPHVSRGTYKAKLFSISRKYVVLWDVQDKRGWLVNATSALLHLLRASIEYNKADELSSCFLFESTDFKEAEVPYTASAAIEVLMNTANLNMVLYDEGDLDENVQFRVRDRIEALYQTLEKIIDYQEMIAGRNGEGLILKSRKDLEGWDFKDIATNEDPIYPRLAKLKTMGKGWVDFTRAIQAVTLFGRGFRNIIEPVRNSGMCSHWKALPPNKYYLAASMADLSRIIDRFGNPRANPPRLTESIAWNPLIMTFKEMRECRADSPCQYELSQTMLPSQLSQRPLRRVPFPLRDIGAVVFGYNKDARWIWNDIGHPKKGDLPESDEESDDDDFPNDSGIGSSSGISSTIPTYEAHGDLRNGSICSALAHENYKIAIICALPKELMAVRALFDNLQCDLPQHENDTNSYALGRMGYHNVVAACLPYEEYGTNAASKVASDMEKSFPNVKWYFVVGIGGGVPSTKDDIRLGDVVVSTGVIQHDMGKTIQGGSGFNHTGIIQRPARSLMTAVSMIRSDPRLPHNPLGGYVADIVKLQSDYGNPGEEHDHLFQFDSKHEAGQATCKSCTGPRAVRKPRPPGPHIHYGLIASGNQVIKDAKTRDRLRDDMNILCFEMEGAGVMTTSNCLVIRGICDYADSHKNDGWHKYAAATAAAYTKFFLSHLQSFDMLSRGVVYVQKRAGSLFDEEENEAKRLRYDWE